MMNNSKSADQQSLHCGKWTPEEEAYVQCLIEEFQAGYLPIREGTSLRSFLSKMLNCKPKRISKKFEGSDYNGKQVYVSQPYKLTAEEARERRDRLCTLEKKFHQSVAELKNAEGMKQQPYVDEPLDAAVVAAGLDTLPIGASLAGGSGSSAAAAGFPSAAAASMQGGNAAMNSINPMANSMANMNSMSSSMSSMNAAAMSSSMSSMNAAAAMSSSMNNPANDLAGGGPNSQILDELAFQESMMRLRAQQQQQQQEQQHQQQLLEMDSSLQQQQQQLQLQQQQQQQQQLDEINLPSQQQQQQQGLGGPTGSYVDPILGSLALSQNAVNTTPLAASQQYWRRQALLEATSSHLDSIRMAQAGAIGIQRPSLEPGGLRDLRVPGGNGNGSGLGGMGGSGFGGGGCDFDGSGGMDPTGMGGMSSLKKRRVSGGPMDGMMNAGGLGGGGGGFGGGGGLPGNSCVGGGLGKGGPGPLDGSNNSSNKRMRRSNDIPGDASKLGRFNF